MENLVGRKQEFNMEKLFSGVYKGKTVMVTGHTGFKGSWLSMWLCRMGAKVVGFSLGPPTEPSHLPLLKLDMVSLNGDVRDFSAVQKAMQAHNPEIVFHLAAQPIVRLSYQQPLETYHTNVMGTANVLEACRGQDSVKAIVCITSDKVYDNQEWAWGYRENDRLGGFDPYSASKACAELVIASYRNAFMNLKNYGKTHNKLIASVRAGNVIGGGDWAPDRLIPDAVRAASRKETVVIRNPSATRPWQHVLECLSGYLVVGEKLLKGESAIAREWNFGPLEGGIYSVGHVVKELGECWSDIKHVVELDPNNPHEAFSLTLDSSFATIKLGWKPAWPNSLTFLRTIDWYREYYTSGKVTSQANLEDYVASAQEGKIPWSKVS